MDLAKASQSGGWSLCRPKGGRQGSYTNTRDYTGEELFYVFSVISDISKVP